MTRSSSVVQFRLESIRAVMADEPPLKEDSRRKNGFFAAMRKFHEQMAAASVVTPATRPINLYYGLVQAGYAICAAKLENRWEFDHHGLDYRMPGSALDSIPATKVLPLQLDKRTGGYQNVSKAVGSTLIDQPLDIESLWACNPDLGAEFQLSPDSTRQSAIILKPVYDLKHRVITFGETATEGVFPYADIRLPGSAPRREDRDQWLLSLREGYYGLGDAELARPEETALKNSDDSETFEAQLRFPTAPSQTAETFSQYFDEFAPVHRYKDTRYVLPRLSGGKPPTPLMTWWLLLYTLSNLARYRPRHWLTYLDLNTSPHAASLNKAMDDALTAIPHLVLNALESRPTLVNPDAR